MHAVIIFYCNDAEASFLHKVILPVVCVFCVYHFKLHCSCEWQCKASRRLRQLLELRVGTIETHNAMSVGGRYSLKPYICKRRGQHESARHLEDAIQAASHNGKKHTRRRTLALALSVAAAVRHGVRVEDDAGGFAPGQGRRWLLSKIVA